MSSYKDIKDVAIFFRLMSEQRIRRALLGYRGEAQTMARDILRQNYRTERAAVRALYTHFNKPIPEPVPEPDPDETAEVEPQPEQPRECNCPPASGLRWMVQPVKWYYSPTGEQFSMIEHIVSSANEVMLNCGLLFERVYQASEAHIAIHHEYIDGAGGTLGLAYQPVTGDDMAACGPMCGNILIDRAENWQAGYFRTVFLHELLHAIGLPHNTDRRSIMFSRYIGERGLHQIDIDELIRRYPYPKTPEITL